MHIYDDIIKWKFLPCYWPFVRGIHWSPVNFPHKVQWRGALMFSLICIWINGWVNNREARDLRCYPAHYDITVMLQPGILPWGPLWGLSYWYLIILSSYCNLKMAEQSHWQWKFNITFITSSLNGTWNFTQKMGLGMRNIFLTHWG